MVVSRLGFVAALFVALAAASPSMADETADPICSLILHQERVEAEEIALALDLAESDLAATEAIFDLIDQLWKQDAVERVIHLTAKHDRAVAVAEARRQRLLLRRQKALIELNEIVCSDSAANDAGEAQRLDAALRMYLQADCHRIGKDLAISEINLAYREELLVSVNDLRANGVATRQDVIRAERNVDRARKGIDHHGRRLKACVDSGAAAGRGGR